MCVYTVMYMYSNICIFLIIRPTIYISSSCRAAGADIPDPLSPFLPIIHHLRQVLGLHPVSSHSCCM